MIRIDLNKLALAITLVVLVLIAAVYDYRLEIGLIGFKFESGAFYPMPSHSR
jgi:hypothetical protein